MSEPIQCFWLSPMHIYKHTLRRYHAERSSAEHKQGTLPCTVPGNQGYHQAETDLGWEPRESRPETQIYKEVSGSFDHADSRWPKACACGYTFQDDDTWQDRFQTLFQRQDTFELLTLADAPAGAMYDATWLEGWPTPDGIHLVVICPDHHEWVVDDQASNCTRKGEPHFCWVRHGDPKATPPTVTVDKNGNTCGAGGGSIQVPGWHGFLREGKLIQA